MVWRELWPTRHGCRRFAMMARNGHVNSAGIDRSTPTSTSTEGCAHDTCRPAPRIQSQELRRRPPRAGSPHLHPRVPGLRGRHRSFRLPRRGLRRAASASHDLHLDETHTSRPEPGLSSSYFPPGLIRSRRGGGRSISALRPAHRSTQELAGPRTAAVPRVQDHDSNRLPAPELWPVRSALQTRRSPNDVAHGPCVVARRSVDRPVPYGPRSPCPRLRLAEPRPHPAAFRRHVIAHCWQPNPTRTCEPVRRRAGQARRPRRRTGAKCCGGQQ